MKIRLSLYWNLFWQFRKLHLMRLFEYRGDFVFWAFVSSMWSLFNLFFFSLLVRVSGSIAGWNQSELMLLLGVFTMIDAFTWSFFYHNMARYAFSIFNGSLSTYLIKPVDTQFLIMTHSNNYTNIFRFFIGLIVFWRSIAELKLQLTASTILLFLITFSAGLLLIYFTWFTITTLAFWVDRLENINEIIPTFRRVFQVPRQVYTGLASLVFTVAIPLGLVSSVPSEILLGQASLVWTLYLLFATGAMFVFSRWFFHYSVKKYSGVGE